MGLALVACNGGGSGVGPGPTEARKSVILTGRGEDGSPASLTWVAFRDGDGAWQRLTPDTSGGYRFDAASGRYMAAFVCAMPDVMQGEVIAATAAELDDIQVPCPAPAGTGVRHRRVGAVRGLPTGGRAQVIFGSRTTGSWAAASSSDGTSYMVDLPPGIYDLVTAVGSTLLVQHDINVDSPGTSDIDLGTGAATAKPQPLPTIATAAKEILESGAFFTSAGGVRVDLSAPKGSVGLLDPADLGRGDSQEVYLEARDDQNGFRGLSLAVPGGPLPALNLPPPLTGVTATIASATPVVRPKITFEAYPNARFYQANVFTDMPDNFVWLMNVGTGWLNGATSFELPDLSGVPGFDPAWGPRNDRALGVQVIGVASNRSFGPLLHDLAPSAGDQTTYGKKLFTLEPAR
jgi:hypothetical protein